MKSNVRFRAKLEKSRSSDIRISPWRRFLVATVLAIRSRSYEPKVQETSAPKTSLNEMSLHGRGGGRKYLNATERKRFREAAEHFADDVRLFCLTLMWSGGRISEALALTPASFDMDSGIVVLTTLKRRRQDVQREVPLPAPLLNELNTIFDIRQRQRDAATAHYRLWPWSRATGWRRVKQVMARANVDGNGAMPKGLRHTFGVSAFSVAPPHLVQRWMGHASLRTTAIYGDVTGAEERAFASRMWRRW